jgi:hypothetical protein
VAAISGMNYLRTLAEGHGYVFNLARIEVGAKKKKEEKSTKRRDFPQEL